MNQAQRVKKLIERVELLERGLLDIIDPIERFKRKAEAEDAVVNWEWANRLSNEANYLKGLARETLASLVEKIDKDADNKRSKQRNS